MKHERGIVAAGRQNWRLKKTLARQIEIRTISPDDMRFAWAAYRKGSLASMSEAFKNPALSQEQFDREFVDALSRYTEGWIIVANQRPIGMVFGVQAPLSLHMIVGWVVWFPWATKRNVLEGTVAFFDTVRRQFPMMGYANGEHKRLYEVVCMHGIMRRVGTSQIIFPGQSAAVYETRA